MFKSSAERESGRGASRNLGTALGVRGAKTARGTKNTRTHPDTPKHSRTQLDTAGHSRVASVRILQTERKEQKTEERGFSPCLRLAHP